MDIGGLFRKMPTVDTTDWLMLPYRARGLFLQLWRKADDDGMVDLGKHGLRGVCVHVGTLADWPQVEPDLKDLLDANAVIHHETRGHLELIDFVAAQGAYVQSPEAQRKREERRLAQEKKAKAQPDMSGHVRDASATCHTEEKRIRREEKRREDLADAADLDSNRSEKTEASDLAQGSSTARAPEQVALLPDEPKRKPARQTRASTKLAPPTTPVWEAYARAFHRRYGTEPVRNGKVSGQLAQFLERVAHADAPFIAVFYVANPDAFYVKQMHPIGLLLRDAEKLAAEWRRGEHVNAETARRTEQAAANPWARKLAERMREERDGVIDHE